MSIERTYPSETDPSTWKDTSWYPAIRQAHLELLALDPDYKILQIKNKFNGLRYYYQLSENVSDAANRLAFQVVRDAERWVETYEDARREAQEENDD